MPAAEVAAAATHEQSSPRKKEGGNSDQVMVLTSQGGAQDQGSEEKKTSDSASLSPSTSSTPASSSINDETLTSALLSSALSPAIALKKYDLTRKELWSYYLYYVGNSGLGPFNFAPSQFQNLLTLQAAAVAPLDAMGVPLCGGTGQPDCKLNWAGMDRTPTSIVLLASECPHSPQPSSRPLTSCALLQTASHSPSKHSSSSYSAPSPTTVHSAHGS